MEKYAVMLDQEKIKTAGSHSPRCSQCGSALEPISNVSKCPQCGTKPFEKQTWATASTNLLEK